MRVVEDASDRLVAWLAAGSEIRYWATVDGSDPARCARSSIPFKIGDRSPHVGGAGVLRVIFADTIYQVIHFGRRRGNSLAGMSTLKHPVGVRATRFSPSIGNSTSGLHPKERASGRTRMKPPRPLTLACSPVSSWLPRFRRAKKYLTTSTRFSPALATGESGPRHRVGRRCHFPFSPS